MKQEETFNLEDFAQACKEKHNNPEDVDLCKACLREVILYMGKRGLIGCGCDNPYCEYH